VIVARFAAVSAAASVARRGGNRVGYTSAPDDGGIAAVPAGRCVVRECQPVGRLPIVIRRLYPMSLAISERAPRGAATHATDLLTPPEYARYRRCSLRTLDRERAEGRGCPFIRLGGRILYRRADIEHYLEAQVRGGARRPEAS
jgi:hypothetical protein